MYILRKRTGIVCKGDLNEHYTNQYFTRLSKNGYGYNSDLYPYVIMVGQTKYGDTKLFKTEKQSLKYLKDHKDRLYGFEVVSEEDLPLDDKTPNVLKLKREIKKLFSDSVNKIFEAKYDFRKYNDGDAYISLYDEESGIWLRLKDGEYDKELSQCFDNMELGHEKLTEDEKTHYKQKWGLV